MGKRQAESFDTIPERRNLDVGSDKKTSEVKGSGRFFFALAKIIVDVIDDELQVSDAHKCAGKTVDMGKRVVRAVASASSKASNVSGQRRLGCNWLTKGWSRGCPG
jgi:hypothetical protein